MNIKKVIGSIASVVVITIAGFNFQQQNEAGNPVIDLAFEEIESIAGCEVSPNMPENRGYCVNLIRSNSAVCVDKGEGPVCSGTI